MTLKDIASVTGKGGLYQVVKPSRTGVILESLDEKKQKLVAHAHDRVSILDEISIYTTDAEGNVPLQKIFNTMHEEFGDDLGIDAKSSKEEIMAFLKHVLPNYDENQVYPSDVKKLVSWYNILLKEAPEVLTAKSEEKKGEDKK
jgi:methylglyoxal synthase|tara:strand:+ start:388 stop:819 length:432 start_codon:yes stop_codon:yes gene_type:complete